MTSKGRQLAYSAVIGVVSMLLTADVAKAELYTYTDNEGVIHFTNIPRGRRSTPQPLATGRNTYEWNDEIGASRQVHRVDVTDYDEIIAAAARYYSLPSPLLKAIIATESAFEAKAVSAKGAQGLMQLIPSTAADMYVTDPFDARDNIYGGARYVRILANRFSGDLRLTIAAYNAGPLTVEKAKDVPAIEETRKYVQRVLLLYHHYLSISVAKKGATK